MPEKSTSSLSISPAERRREELDSVIEKHLEQLVIFKHERNQLAPISRLPPEVMSNIFAYVKMPNHRIEINSSPLLWIPRVTHISSHWRSIALNTPILWTDLPLSNPRWTAEMIKRSKMAGLSFDLNGSLPARQLDPVLEQIREHSSRIRRLVLSSVSNSTQKFMDTLPMSLAELEILHIRGSKPTYSWGNAIPQYVLVQAAFLAGATKLHEVDLSDLKLDWSPHLLSNTITQLKIRYIAPDTAPTLVQFMDTLQNLPELRFLDINIDFQTIESREKDRVSNEICLTKLQKLNIAFTNSGTEIFFQRVTFPPSACVEVSTRDTVIPGAAAPNGGMDVSAIITAISRSYSNGAFCFRSLVLDNNTGLQMEHVGIGLRLMTKTSKYMIPWPECDSPCLSLSFRWIQSNDIKYEKVVVDLLSNELLLQEIDDVRLLYIDNVKPETLAHTIGSLPKVLRISTNGRIGNALISALQLSASADSVDNLYFPNISKLQFEGLAFENDAADAQGPHDLAVEELEDGLIQHYESGREILELKFEDCVRLDEEIIGQLRDIVVEVLWDGCKRGFEASEEDEDEEEYSYDHSVDYEDEVDSDYYDDFGAGAGYYW